MNVASRGRPARYRLFLGGAVVLLALGLVVLGLVVGGPDRGGSAGAVAATPTAASSSGIPTGTSSGPPRGTSSGTATSTGTGEPPPQAPVTPEPTGPPRNVDEPPPSLPAVALDDEAAVGNGITAEVVSLDAIAGTGTGPGNIAGPALRVTVQISNGTTAPVSLDGVVVDLTHGADLAPASPLDDPSAAPFTGTVEPQGHREGVYVFTVPEDQRDAVTVSVGYQAGAPFLLFTGSAG
jgi:hypothetical protein